MRTRPFLLTLVAVAALAGLAYGLRSSGVWEPTAAALQDAATPAAKPAGKAPAAGGGGSSGGRPPAPVEVTMAKVESLSDSISAIGNLLANESADVAADSNGRIISITAADGAVVAKGDALFLLDGALLEAEVKDAEARMALAEATFRRSQTLARSQNAAQSQVDQTRAELEQARSALQLAQERQRRLVVRAPFNGHLGFRKVSEGAYVTAGTPLVRIDQITTLKVSVSLPERFFTSLSIGQEVDVTADAVPGKTFRARITVINPVVDVNGRALQVLAELDNSALALRPGMLVRAQVLGTARQAVMVNESAVVPQGKDIVVFAVEDGKAKRLVVSTGQRRDGFVEITSGLSSGVQVVSAGNARLSDGAPVKTNTPTTTQ